MGESPRERAARTEAKRRAPRARWRSSVAVLAWAAFAATRLVFADPVPESAGSCPAAGVQEARALADRLYENEEYRRAAECYDAAGDPLRAQRAFVRAAGPGAESAARGIKEERNTAKTLFTHVQQAFRSNH